ncbi:hypothetical protein JTE90_015692 [Oedothorax gibbosus]|uniref:Uncharacterized protein n=1 Tax=Oedothorax gibbosus TaxID=931172 RepID=A0AAV6TQD1_9ARAC|nr:hypothetical protein JTE90_015692 [Oedothorax gibbosus]
MEHGTTRKSLKENPDDPIPIPTPAPSTSKAKQSTLDFFVGGGKPISKYLIIGTSINDESFIATTVHFIDEDGDGDLNSLLLGCSRFEASHTSVNLGEDLKSKLQLWGLEGKVVCVTTDNASNNVRAIAQCRFRQMGCFAHSLNLIVKSCLQLEDVKKSNLEDQKNGDVFQTKYRRPSTPQRKPKTYADAQVEAEKGCRNTMEFDIRYGRPFREEQKEPILTTLVWKFWNRHQLISTRMSGNS